METLLDLLKLKFGAVGAAIILAGFGLILALLIGLLVSSLN